MIWRFEDAPEILKSLHRKTETPEWLVLVPCALSGTDLDQLIVQGAIPEQIARYETSDGDIIYIGTSKCEELQKGTRPLSGLASNGEPKQSPPGNPIRRD